jgi:hypothetical protein
MPLYAYNLEMAIDKFWQVQEVTAKNLALANTRITV